MRAMVTILRRVLDATAALLLLLLLGLTSSQVAFRYIFGISMPWTEELTRLLFVWLVLVAASRTRHMNIDVVAGLIPPGRSRRGFEIGIALVGIAILAVLIRYSFGLLEIVAYDRYTALGISVQYLYWAVIVGSGLWIVTSIAELFVDSTQEPPKLS